MILFRFRGAVYRFERCVINDVDEYISTTSLEKAITCVKDRMRERLGLVKNTDIRLSGTMSIKYDADHIEIYRLVKNKLQGERLLPTPFGAENGKVRLDDIRAKVYGKKVVSIEEAKEIYLIETAPVKRTFILIDSNGERTDVTDDIEEEHLGDYLIYQGDFYKYEDGVYWKNEHRFAERIEQF